MSAQKKTLIYALVAMVSLAVAAKSFSREGNFRFLETSLLNILKNVAEDNKPLPPDLAIENVTLKKIADPKENFPYYKYHANIVIKNRGGSLTDAKVGINGRDQKSIFLTNSPEGFSLARGRHYIMDRYEVLFDGNYNGGTITLEVDLKDRADSDRSNNRFSVEIFESPAKLNGITVEKILEDGTLVLKFEPASFALNTDSFGVFTGPLVSADEEDEKYAEVVFDNRAYGYHRLKNSEKYIKDTGWKEEKKSELNSHFVKFSQDPFADDKIYYLYVKAQNSENGNYAVSNILKFSPQEVLNRGRFAKLFTDYAKVEISSKGVAYFSDVSSDSWYAPYVQTLYNLGLINTGSYKFYPEKAISRGDVLKVVLDYFDVDLAVESGVKSREKATDPYIQALYASGRGSVLRDQFNPDQPATKNFLKYLINEYT